MGSDYWLAIGPHATPQDGRCAMEWVSYLAGEPHSDQPACVSPGLRAFCVALNDGLEKNARQRLRPYLARTIGTADDGMDDTRSWMAMDWLVRVYVPAWFELAGLSETAQQLALGSPLQEVSELAVAIGKLELARRHARAAVTPPLLRSRTAWMPPSAPGRSARKAAWASGEAAVWVVARVPLGGRAGEAGHVAARAAAGDAAAIAARAASARCGPMSRRDAIRAALAPTLEGLRQSCFALLEQMLPTEPLVPAAAHSVAVTRV